MSVRVPIHYSTHEAKAATYIARPFATGLADAYVQRINHMIGAQLPLIWAQSFGTSEGSSGTYRILHNSSFACRALLFVVVPVGRTSISTRGTVTVAGADDPSVQDVAQDAASVSTPADLSTVLRFRKTVAASTFGEHTLAVSNVRLHSVCVYEIPRSILKSTDDDPAFLDETFSHVDRKFSDDDDGGGRGYAQVMRGINDARRIRRHWNAFQLNGLTASSALKTTVWDKLRYRGRDLRSAVDDDEMRHRVWVYVGSIGAGTWTVTLEDSGGADVATIAGITATGWSPSIAAFASGAAFQMRSDAVDDLIITAQRTAGAGNLRIDGWSAPQAATSL